MTKSINAQSKYFEHTSTRPLDRLAYLIQREKAKFSDEDLRDFSISLETEVHQVREFISVLGDIYQDAPCLDFGQEMDVHDLRNHYKSLFNALSAALNKLSEFSDLGLVCAYAGCETASRLSFAKGEQS